jgi:hypothetical protein
MQNTTGSYSGIFDGNGKTVDLDITIARAHAVLFANQINGTVKNLRLTGSVTVSSTSGDGYFAAIVHATGTAGIIRNISSQVTVSSSNDYMNVSVAGGIVGFNRGTVENCYSTGDISALNGNVPYAGGIVGRRTGTVNRCWTSGVVTTNRACVAGGIFGYLEETSSRPVNVSNCVALNPSLSLVADDKDFSARVVGRSVFPDVFSYSNNFGLSTMTGTFSSDTGDNGTNVTSANANTQGWWTGTARWEVHDYEDRANASEESPWVWDDRVGSATRYRPVLWFEM